MDLLSVRRHATDEAESKLEKALPVTKVKYCTRKIIVKLYKFAATAENVLNNLKNKWHTAERVMCIKTKSKSDSYRYFVIQCGDLDCDEIKNNEKLRHPSTRVGEVRKEPRDDQIIETAGTSS